MYIYSTSVIAQSSIEFSPKQYTPIFFGPNALPVPEFSNGYIPKHTTISVAQDGYIGKGIAHGDLTTNTRIDVEIPLLPERIAIKIWITTLEYYKVSEQVNLFRQMQPNVLRGSASGDFYVQTRFAVLKESTYIPQIIVNATLKTASGTQFLNRRYYDTPGYYFDLEIAKSIPLNNPILDNIRFIINGGFLCWETTNSTQNDAPLYDAKIILSNQWCSWENSVGGYYGWMNNGDHPLVYRTKINYIHKFFQLGLQYQYGIIDYPYHQIRVGISVPIPVLTPKYK